MSDGTRSPAPARAAHFFALLAVLTLAQPVASQPQDRAAATAALAAAVPFDASALEANRAGQLAPAQITRLQHNARLFLALGVAFTAAGVLFVSGRLKRVPRMVALPAGIFAVVCFSRVIPFARDASGGRAATAEGPARAVQTVSMRNTGQPSSQVLLIDGHRFTVPYAAIALFHDAPRYRVYYAPHSEMMLSAEPAP